MTPEKVPSKPAPIPCPRLDIDSFPEWDRVDVVWAGAPAIALGQGWNPRPEARFCPAEVRVGWTASALWVHATLTDEDIFNPVMEFNAPSFEQGDVFEMFLRPLPADRYYEFHVTPANQKFQLSIPSAEEFAAIRGRGGLPPRFYLSDRVLDTAVRVVPEKNRWEVLARIPFDFVGAVVGPDDGLPLPWLVSFSRYDYRRDHTKPVLSSTSAHEEVDFHRQQEWRELVFGGGD